MLSVLKGKIGEEDLINGKLLVFFLLFTCWGIVKVSICLAEQYSGKDGGVSPFWAQVLPKPGFL